MTNTPAAPTTPRRFRRLWAVLAAVAVLITGASVAGTAMAATGPKPTVKALGADVVHLEWSAVSGATKYKVRYSTSSSMSSATTLTQVEGKDITTPFTNVMGLTAKKTYYFQVVGLDSADKELNSWGNTSSGAKTSYAYATPTGVAAANIASTWVELSWQSVSGAPGYKVRYYNKTDGSAYVWNQVENFTLHGKDDSDSLRKNTQYWVSVAVQQPAIGTFGTKDYTPLITMSALSSEITLTTSNYDIAAPSNLAVSEQKSDQVKVAWDAPSGMTSGMKYRVQYSTNSDMSSSKSIDVTDTDVTLTGLTTNTTFYVRVMVIDSAGTQKSDRSAYQIAKTRVPRGTLKGSVSGPSSHDVVAMIYDTDGELVAQSDVSGGDYSASIRPGSYKVLLSYLGENGYTSMWAANGSANGVPVSGSATVVNLSGTAATATVPKVTLAKGATISGTVKANNSGLNGVDITSLTAQTSARETEIVTQTPGSSAAGSYTLKGLSDGAHWLRFIKVGYSNVSIWINVEDAKVTQYRISTQSDPTNFGSGSTLNVNMTAS